MRDIDKLEADTAEARIFRDGFARRTTSRWVVDATDRRSCRAIKADGRAMVELAENAERAARLSEEKRAALKVWRAKPERGGTQTAWGGGDGSSGTIIAAGGVFEALSVTRSSCVNAT